MRTQRASSRLLWLVPALGVAACSGQKGNDQQAANAAPPAVPEAPAVVMATRNNSGITGTATLMPSGDSTMVMVALHGATPGQSYASHVHAGGCDQPGAMLVPLTSVVAGADSSGSSTTTVATATLDSLSRQYGALLVQSHLSNGTPAACGALPAR
jgi:hypothetical protein